MSFTTAFFSSWVRPSAIFVFCFVYSVKYLRYSPVSVVSNFAITGSPSAASILFIMFLSPFLYFFIDQPFPGDFLLSFVCPMLFSQRYRGSPPDAPNEGHMYWFSANFHFGDLKTQSAAFIGVSTLATSLPLNPIVFRVWFGSSGFPSESKIPSIILFGLYLSNGLSSSAESGVRLLGPSSSGGSIL